MPKYYIIERRHVSFVPILGPYETKKEAEAEKDTHFKADHFSQWEDWQVISRTALAVLSDSYPRTERGDRDLEDQLRIEGYNQRRADW